MSDSEGATPSPSPPPSVPTSSRSKRSAFAPPAKRNSQMALPIQPPVPTFIPNPQPITPNVASVASALFAMTTPPQGDGSPANSRERWQMCIYAVINKSVMLNQQTTQQSMILKDLETADKVMKKEPEETPPPSVDASPLQVMRPPPPQVPNNNSGGPPAPPVVPAATPNRIVPSSTASPYGSPLGASLLSNQPLVLPFAPINGDFDFNAAIAAVSQPKPG
uniref:Hydroxyproline-rich glycoprotein family protein n=1 Tax=Caenorhabditis tropicalis TaxID=1561998 RepID=A0A1I7T392_9PELO